MNFRRIILSAVFFLALCVACQPVEQGPAPGLRPLAAASMVSCTTGTDFAQNKVQIISFDPSTQFTDPPGGPSAGGTRFAADLNAAFAAAPQSFKAQLCGLDGVFINLQNCTSVNDCSNVDGVVNSWGLRESKLRNANYGGRYIALSGGLWGDGSHAPNYHLFETSLLYELLSWPINNSSRPYYPPNSTDSTDSPAMTVLAALAHEFGHVLWYDTNNADRAPTYDPNGFCPGSSAGLGFFRAWDRAVIQPPPWRGFGDVDVNALHASAPQTRGIQNKVGSYQFNAAAADVDKIYSPGFHWPSLFASFSPDEDFIETFKLAVLLKANPPLQHLPLLFPSLNNKTEDVPGTLTQRPGLSARISCFAVN